MLLAGSAALADLHPDKLSGFRLDASPPLRGFQRAQPEAHQAPLLDSESGAAATLNARYFHGPTELSYSVLFFPTEQALTEWDRSMRSSNPAWFSPLRKPLKDGIRESRLGGEIRPHLPRGKALVINRAVIMLNVYQHREMIRRAPKLAGKAMPDAELARRMEQVRAELVRRARALPANR